MAIETSDELSNFLKFLTGEEFPAANEDRIFTVAQAHHHAADGIIGSTDTFANAVRMFRAGMEGEAEQAYVDTMEQYVLHNPGFLGIASKYVHRMGTGYRDTATEVQYAKLMIIASLIELFLEFLAALALAWINPGLALSKLAIGKAIMDFLKNSLLARIIMRVVISQILGVGLQVLMDVFVQLYQRKTGTRDRWNPELTKSAAAIGSLGGAVGLGFSGIFDLAERLFKRMDLGENFTNFTKPKLTPGENPFPEILNEGLSEYFTEGLYSSMTGHGWDVDGIAFVAGALSGVAGASGTAIGEGLHNAGQKDKTQANTDVPTPLYTRNPSPDESTLDFSAPPPAYVETNPGAGGGAPGATTSVTTTTGRAIVEPASLAGAGDHGGNVLSVPAEDPPAYSEADTLSTVDLGPDQGSAPGSGTTTFTSETTPPATGPDSTVNSVAGTPSTTNSAGSTIPSSTIPSSTTPGSAATSSAASSSPASSSSASSGGGSAGRPSAVSSMPSGPMPQTPVSKGLGDSDGSWASPPKPPPASVPGSLAPPAPASPALADVSPNVEVTSGAAELREVPHSVFANLADGDRAARLEAALAEVLPDHDGTSADCVSRLGAVHAKVTGRRRSTRDDSAGHPARPEQDLARDLDTTWQGVSDWDAVIAAVRDGGPGSVALVLADRVTGRNPGRHGFALVNEGGEPYWVETQAGPGSRVRPVTAPPELPVGGRAIVLDRNAAPVTLARTASATVNALTLPPPTTRYGLLGGSVAKTPTLETPQPESTPAQRVQVPADGFCLLYSVVASDPVAVLGRLRATAPDHPLLADADVVAWLNDPARVRADVVSQAVWTAHQGVPVPAVSPLARVTAALVDVVGDRLIAESDALPESVLRVRGSIAEAQRTQEPRLTREERLARLRAMGPDHVTAAYHLDPDALRKRYLVAASPSTVDGLSRQQQLDYLNERGQGFTLDELSDEATHQYYLDRYGAWTEPIIDEELELLTNAVADWSQEYLNPVGEAFLPLLAHVFDVRLEVLDRENRAPRATYGEPDRTAITLLHNDRDHYDGGAPEGAALPSTDEVARDIELGPAVRSNKVKGSELDDAGDMRLNPLWHPLPEFPSSVLDPRRAQTWLYAVDEHGEIFLGAEEVGAALRQRDFRELLAGMRRVEPTLTEEQLRSRLGGQGHVTIAAGMDPDTGRTVERYGRVSGELSWNAEAGRWEVNDRSDRYLSDAQRPDATAADAERWITTVADRLTEALGVDVTPVLYAEPVAPPARADARTTVDFRQGEHSVAPGQRAAIDGFADRVVAEAQRAWVADRPRTVRVFVEAGGNGRAEIAYYFAGRSGQLRAKAIADLLVPNVRDRLRELGIPPSLVEFEGISRGSRPSANPGPTDGVPSWRLARRGMLWMEPGREFDATAATTTKSRTSRFLDAMRRAVSDPGTTGLGPHRTADGRWLIDGGELIVRSIPGRERSVVLLSDADWARVADPVLLVPGNASVPVLVRGSGDGQVLVPVRHDDGSVRQARIGAAELQRILADRIGSEEIVALLSCAAGTLGSAFTQRLANLRRQDVLAPTGDLIVGSPFGTDGPLSADGRPWALFTPGSIDGEGWDLVNDELADGTVHPFDEFVSLDPQGREASTRDVPVAEWGGVHLASGWEAELRQFLLHDVEGGVEQLRQSLREGSGETYLVRSRNLSIVIDGPLGARVPEVVVHPVAVLPGDDGHTAVSEAFRDFDEVVALLGQVGLYQRRKVTDLFTEPKYEVHPLFRKAIVQRTEDNDALMLAHYSLGVPVAGLQDVLAAVPGKTYVAEARNRLTHALQFGEAGAQRFQQTYGDEATPEAVAEIKGYLALVYTQIAAVRDSLDGGNFKDRAAAVSRVSLSAIRASMSGQGQQFLHARMNSLAQSLDAELGPEWRTSPLRNSSTLKGLDYFRSAVDPTAEEIDQLTALGVRTRFSDLDDNGGRLDPALVVLELRSYGDNSAGTSMAELRDNHDDVARLASTSYNSVRGMRGQDPSRLPPGAITAPHPVAPAAGGSAQVPPQIQQAIDLAQGAFEVGSRDDHLAGNQQERLAEAAYRIADAIVGAKEGGVASRFILELEGGGSGKESFLSKGSEKMGKARAKDAWTKLEPLIKQRLARHGWSPAQIGDVVRSHVSSRGDKASQSPHAPELATNAERRQVFVWLVPETDQPTMPNVGGWNLELESFGSAKGLGPTVPTRSDHSAESLLARYPWISHINPDRELDTNCVIAAIAFVVSMREDSGFEIPGTDRLPGRDLVNFQRDSLGLSDEEHQAYLIDDLDAARDALTGAEPGSVALIAMRGPDGSVPHVYVGIRDEAGVSFVDPQTGTLAEQPVQVTGLAFLSLSPSIPTPSGAILATLTPAPSTTDPNVDWDLEDTVNQELERLGWQGSRVSAERIAQARREIADVASPVTTKGLADDLAMWIMGERLPRLQGDASGWEAELHQFRLRNVEGAVDELMAALREGDDVYLVKSRTVKVVIDGPKGERVPEVVVLPVALLPGETGRTSVSEAFRDFDEVISAFGQLGLNERRPVRKLFPASKYQVHELFHSAGVERISHNDASMLLHYSVGVPVAGLHDVLSEVVKKTYVAFSREFLQRALKFGAEHAQRFATAYGAQVSTEDVEAIKGYLALVYTQVAAVSASNGYFKDNAAAVSRISLSTILASLSEQVREYVRNHEGDFAQRFDADLGPRWHTRLLRNDESLTAADYLNSAVDPSAEEIDQFTALGVRTRLPGLDSNQGVLDPSLVVIELRSYGTGSQGTSMSALRDHHDDIARWASTSYNTVRALRGLDSSALSDAELKAPRIAQHPATVSSAPAQLPNNVRAAYHRAHDTFAVDSGADHLAGGQDGALNLLADRIVEAVRAGWAAGVARSTVYLEGGGSGKKGMFSRGGDRQGQDRADDAWRRLGPPIERQLVRNGWTEAQVGERLWSIRNSRADGPSRSPHAPALSSSEERRQVFVWLVPQTNQPGGSGPSASSGVGGGWNLAQSSFGSARRLGATVPIASGHSPESLLARYPWTPDINPDRDQGGELDTNCVIAAISFVLSMREGGAFEIPGSTWLPGSDLVNFQRDSLGENRAHLIGDLDAARDALAVAEPGDVALVAVRGPDGDASHVFVGIRDEAGVSFVDPQTGALAEMPVEITGLAFLPLSPDIPAPVGGRPLTADEITALTPERPASGEPTDGDGSVWRQVELSRPVNITDIDGPDVEAETSIETNLAALTVAVDEIAGPARVVVGDDPLIDPNACVVLAGRILEVLYPERFGPAIAPARTVDDSVLDGRQLSGLAPGVPLVPVGYQEVNMALAEAGEGASAVFVWQREDDLGHVFLAHNLGEVDGYARIVYVDPHQPPGQRVLGREPDNLYSEARLRAVLVDPGGREIPLVRGSAASTVPALIDPPRDPRYGRGAMENELHSGYLLIPDNVEGDSDLLPWLARHDEYGIEVTVDHGTFVTLTDGTDHMAEPGVDPATIRETWVSSILEMVMRSPLPELPGDPNTGERGALWMQERVATRVGSLSQPGEEYSLAALFPAADGWTVHPNAGGVAYVPVRRAGSSFVSAHQTHGVPLGALKPFMSGLTDRIWPTPGQRNYPLELHRLGAEFARAMANQFAASGSPRLNQGVAVAPPTAQEIEELEGVMWVTFVHVAALALGTTMINMGGKSYSATALRQSLAQLRQELSPAAQSYLTRDAAVIRIAFEAFFLSRFLDFDAKYREFRQQILAPRLAGQFHVAPPPLPASSSARPLDAVRLARRTETHGMNQLRVGDYLDTVLLDTVPQAINQYQGFGVRTFFDDLDRDRTNRPGLFLIEVRNDTAPLIEPNQITRLYDGLAAVTRNAVATVEPPPPTPSTGRWNLGRDFFGSAAVLGATVPIRSDHSNESLLTRYPWISGVNPDRDRGGELVTNCVIAGISLVLSIREGGAFEASGSTVLPGSDLVNFQRDSLGLPGEEHRAYLIGDLGAARAALATADIGAVALIAVRGRDGDAAHVYVGIRDEAGVSFVDPQTGALARQPVGLTGLAFLPLSSSIPAPVGGRLLTAGEVAALTPVPPDPSPPDPRLDNGRTRSFGTRDQRALTAAARPALEVANASRLAAPHRTQLDFMQDLTKMVNREVQRLKPGSEIVTNERVAQLRATLASANSPRNSRGLADDIAMYHLTGRLPRMRAGALGSEAELHHFRLHIPDELGQRVRTALAEGRRDTYLVNSAHLRMVIDGPEDARVPEVVLDPAATVPGDTGRVSVPAAFDEFDALLDQLSGLELHEAKPIGELMRGSRFAVHPDFTGVRVQRLSTIEQMMLHYSVGIPLAEVYPFLVHVVERTNHPRAEINLKRALEFGASYRGRLTSIVDSETLAGYLTLVHSQVFAVARGEGFKDNAAAVSRVSLQTILKALPASVQQYIAANRSNIEAAFRVPHNTRLRYAEGTAADYLASALSLEKPEIDQYGALGVRTRLPGLDSNSGRLDPALLVLELRAYGSGTLGSTRAKMGTDHDTLAREAADAYDRVRQGGGAAESRLPDSELYVSEPAPAGPGMPDFDNLANLGLAHDLAPASESSLRSAPALIDFESGKVKLGNDQQDKLPRLVQRIVAAAQEAGAVGLVVHVEGGGKEHMVGNQGLDRAKSVIAHLRPLLANENPAVHVTFNPRSRGEGPSAHPAVPVPADNAQRRQVVVWVQVQRP